MLGVIASTAAVASATLQQTGTAASMAPAARHGRANLIQVKTLTSWGEWPAPAGGAPAASPRPRLDPWSLSSRIRVSAARSTFRQAASASAAALARALSSRSLSFQLELELENSGFGSSRAPSPRAPCYSSPAAPHLAGGAPNIAPHAAAVARWCTALPKA